MFFILFLLASVNKIKLIYQLPNGKVLKLTLEQYLSLTDDDLKYAVEKNFGGSCGHNPFDKNMDPGTDDEEPEIEFLDIPDDNDDRVPIDTINLDHLFDED